MTPETHLDVGLSLRDFCSSWEPLLDELGDALVSRARPALGALINPPEDEEFRLPAALVRRQLTIGWRTWFPSAYVETLGEEFLLGLPGRSGSFGQGGVQLHRAAGQRR